MTRTETVEVRLPKWQWRFLATILVIVVGAGHSGLYGSIREANESKVGWQELQENTYTMHSSHT